MQALSRTIGLGFIALCLLSVALKAFVPLPSSLAYAPIDLGFAAKPQPVEIVIWYGTEKRLWLEEAVRLFALSTPTVGARPISIKLVALGSRELADRVARRAWGNDPPPDVVSPASSVWTEALRSDWAARGGDAIFSGEPVPLVLTPLVAVAWEERANLIWPNGTTAFWQNLGEAISAKGGWAEIATQRGFAPGSPQHTKAEGWGFVKFGHTSPLTSNSGTQTLALLAYAYYQKTANLRSDDIEAPAFQNWLESIERATLDFGESTGTLMTNMVRFGPSRFDVVMVYENLAIEGVENAQRQWNQPIHIYYPPATMLSDHPYAILDTPLTTADERAAAEHFRTFLLSEPLQTLALQYGFRPANPQVTLTSGGSTNPFTKLATYGLQVDIAQQVETPSSEVTRELIELWERRIAPLTLKQP